MQTIPPILANANLNPKTQMTRPNITPGPWHINGEEIEGLAAPRESNSYYAPVCVMDNEWEKSIAEANARAIAAVPALLEALEALLYDPERGENQKARSALIAAGYQF